MDKDIEKIIKKAEKVGGIAKEAVEEILKELEIELEDFQNNK